MLLRMYMRWAEAHGYKVEWIEESAGEEAGIKSATIKVSGHNAYGWLKTESGVHRLVRISPFDSNARRHTSFASAWVYPVIDETSRSRSRTRTCASTPTARRAPAASTSTRPTARSASRTCRPASSSQCQNDRSQHQNRAQAWEMLRARLYELELQKREAAADAESASKTDIGWGHQIRSYVLQPYQMVKDLRTGVEKRQRPGRARRRYRRFSPGLPGRRDGRQGGCGSLRRPLRDARISRIAESRRRPRVLKRPMPDEPTVRAPVAPGCRGARALAI